MSALAGSEGLAQAGAGGGAVFELREYHANEGKLDACSRAFATIRSPSSSGMALESVAYWTPTDDPLKGKTLFYILKHPSREAATANWAAFHDDPEWKSVSAASEVNGKLVDKVESTFLKLTDFSPRL